MGDIKQMCEDIEARAKVAGVSMAELCRRAKTTRQTFINYKRGRTDPFKCINAIYGELVKCENEKE